MTSDIDSMSELIQFCLQQFLANGLLLVLTVALLAFLSLPLMGVCLISVPIVFAASIRFQRRSNTAYLTVGERIGQNLSTMQEGITGSESSRRTDAIRGPKPLSSRPWSI